MFQVQNSLNEQLQTGGLNKSAEVPVPRDKDNSAVDTALSDERFAQARLSISPQNSSAQPASPLPIAGMNLDLRQIRKCAGGRDRKMRVAQQFGKHRGCHDDLSILKRPAEHLDIVRSLPQGTRSMCWYRLRSPIRLQISQRS